MHSRLHPAIGQPLGPSPPRRRHGVCIGRGLVKEAPGLAPPGRWMLQLAARGVAVVVHGGALGFGLAREGEGGRSRWTAKRLPRPGSSPPVCGPMGHVCCCPWKLLVWAVDLF
jgi:hypothetical protein